MCSCDRTNISNILNAVYRLRFYYGYEKLIGDFNNMLIREPGAESTGKFKRAIKKSKSELSDLLCN
jgi:hypothetical protein